MTASRIEASFDVAASATLSEEDKRRIIARVGPRVVAVAQDDRSQARNRELALKRLQRRLTIALAIRAARHPTNPSRAAKHRRLQAKRRHSERKRARRRPAGEED